MGIGDIFHSKCQKYFTVKTRTINIKGLSANLQGKQLGDFSLGVGELTIRPEFVKATERLQELDVIQFDICQNIHKLNKRSARREELLEKLIETQIEMLRIAQRPDDFEKKTLKEIKTNTTEIKAVVNEINQRLSVQFNPPPAPPADQCAFITEVSSLYRMMDYVVDTNCGYEDCLLVTEKSRFGSDRSFLVGVKFSTETINRVVIESFAGQAARAIHGGRADQAAFVTNGGYDPSAQDLAQAENITLQTAAGLLASLIDFGPYIRRFMQEVENDKNHLLEVYVDLNCAKLDVAATLDKARQHPQPEEALRHGTAEVSVDVKESVWQPLEGLIDKHIMAWLATSEAPHHISILGDFGAGKTSFCKHFTYRLLERYQQQKALASTGEMVRLPVYIPLKEYAELGADGGDKALLTHYLVNKMDVKTDFKALEKWAQAGKLLFILDGFDEMVQKIDPQTRDENFSVLARLAQPPNKIILTGRPGYFPSLTNIMITFGHELAPHDPYQRAGKRIDKKMNGDLPRYDILKLNLFTLPEIGQYLDRQTIRLHKTDPANAARLKPAIMGMIEKNPQIADLSERPVLLWMIVEALPDLLEKLAVEDINLAELYRIFTDKSLKRDWGKGKVRQLIIIDQRRDFMRHLAWQLLSRSMPSISIAELQNMTDSFFKTKDLLEAAHMVNDICTCTFLTHDERDGYFKFVHKSFMEYYAADKIAQYLIKQTEANEEPAIRKLTINEAIRDFIHAMLYGRWQPPVYNGKLPAGLEQRGGLIYAAPVHMEMVYIPPGPFILGEQDDIHVVMLSKGFFIGRSAVTVGQFARFIQVTGYKTTAEEEGSAFVYDGSSWRDKKGAGWRNPGFSQEEDHPVLCVSWHDAIAFCNWMSEKTGGAFQLPRELEWEKAARGVDGRIFPWGDAEPDKQRCNFEMNIGRTTSVTSYPAGQSPYGLFDCAGNVVEWCADKWHDSYVDLQDDGKWGEDGDGSNRVLRGGGWNYGAQFCRSANRGCSTPDNRSLNVGFRLVFVPQSVGSLSGHTLSNDELAECNERERRDGATGE
ncbi:MAG: SUMF1/EgtB/PvdO family nonheme iron enzyme [bacterium]